MTKRADNKFVRKERNFYPTPYEAVVPLIPHLTNSIYIEPFAGAGDLVKHLSIHGLNCKRASDIYPQEKYILEEDYVEALKSYNSRYSIITNPPWDRDIIDNLLKIVRSGIIYRNCWLLLSADIAHNVWMAEHMKYCKKIVSVGRVKWIPDSKSSGFDNCCWYNFGSEKCDTIFIGRETK